MAKKKTKKQIFDREVSDIIGDAVNIIYLPAMKKATPKKTGQTSESWRVVIEKDIVYLMNIQFGHIIEFLNDGTKPHTIEPKNAKALRFVIDGKVVFAKKVEHPGIEARKFVDKILNDKGLENKFSKIVDTKMQKILDEL